MGGDLSTELAEAILTKDALGVAGGFCRATVVGHIRTVEILLRGKNICSNIFGLCLQGETNRIWV